MGIIAHLRGLMGLPGPAGANGVVGLFVGLLANKVWSVSKSSSALTPNLSGGFVTVNVTGWYTVNWSGAVYRSIGQTIALTAQASQCVIAGPLT